MLWNMALAGRLESRRVMELEGKCVKLCGIYGLGEAYQYV